MNWTVYTEALYAYFQLIHCIYIFLFRYFTSLHRGVSQQQLRYPRSVHLRSPARQRVVPPSSLRQELVSRDQSLPRRASRANPPVSSVSGFHTSSPLSPSSLTHTHTHVHSTRCNTLGAGVIWVLTWGTGSRFLY